MNVRIFPVILLFILSEFSFSQEIVIDPNSQCGTPDLSEYFDSFNTPDASVQLRSSSTSYFPLNIVSVGKDDGTGHMDPLEIRSSLCVLNQDFDFLDIQFYIKGEIKILNNSNYYNHNSAYGFDMMRRNNDREAFNVYIVNSPDSTCGYFAPSTPAIAIAKNCFEGEQHALTHEMGHYLGLPHTFYGWESMTYDDNHTPNTLSIRGRDTLYTERVSGQYCDKASDGFCDTPPDYISSRWNCDDDGYSLRTYKDPDGVEFRVDGKNFMSYSYNSCQQHFSTEQATTMLFNLLDSQKGKYAHLKYDYVPDEILSGVKIIPIAPIQGDPVNYKNVRLQWEVLAGSTQYQVEISRFNGILFDQDPNKIILHTTNAFVDIDPNELRLNTNYYWKITPLNSFTLCPVSSIEHKFYTTAQTNTQQFSTGEKVTITPNLAHQNSDHVSIHFMVKQSKSLKIELLNLQGKIIASETKKVYNDERYAYSLPSLAPGMYFFKISDQREHLVQKIVIQ